MFSSLPQGLIPVYSYEDPTPVIYSYLEGNDCKLLLLLQHHGSCVVLFSVITFLCPKTDNRLSSHKKELCKNLVSELQNLQNLHLIDCDTLSKILYDNLKTIEVEFKRQTINSVVAKFASTKV